MVIVLVSCIIYIWSVMFLDVTFLVVILGYLTPRTYAKTISNDLIILKYSILAEGPGVARGKINFERKKC